MLGTHRTINLVCWLALCTALPIGVGAQFPDSKVPPLVIQGATVIDGTGASPFAALAVVVEHGRIQHVVKAGKSVTYAVGAKVIDASGMYLLPGLIDAHVHLRGWDLELYAAFGVTSVVDTGSATDWILLQRQGIAEGHMRGPRIFASGNVLGGRPADRGAFQKPHHTWIDSAQSGREAVRRHTEAGVDLIKLYPGMTPDVLKVIIGDAHAAGLSAGGHVNSVSEALDVGYDFISHWAAVAPEIAAGPGASRKDIEFFGGDIALFQDVNWAKADALIAKMVEAGVFWDPVPRTTFEFAHRDKFQHEDVDLLLNTPALRYVPLNARLGIIKEYNQAGRLWWRDLSETQQGVAWKSYRNALEFARRFAAAGGKIITGSDTWATAGLSLHQALEILSKEIGLSPMEALLTVTRNPAQLHRMKNLGSVEVGKIADLIVLSKNPLDDIRHTRSIEYVIQNGELRDSSFHPDFANPIPRPDPERTSHLFPSPIVNRVTPRMIRLADTELEITVVGSGFIPYSTVFVQGTPVATNFKDRFTLTALIPARLLSRVGTYPVHVENPAGPVGTITAAGQQAFAVFGERDEKSNSVSLMVGFRVRPEDR